MAEGSGGGAWRLLFEQGGVWERRWDAASLAELCDRRRAVLFVPIDTM